jgi:hypothetical protein
MFRNFKVLGLALVAVFAMSAVAASAASANFISATTPTILEANNTGQGAHVFSTESGAEVSCTTAAFAGTSEGTSVASVEMHPTYSGCTFLGATASVTTTGCNYVFLTAGGVQVKCETGKTIEVNAAGACTLKVGAQSPGGSATYTNSSPNIGVNANVTGITYTTSGPLCFLVSGPGAYKGKATVSGFKDSSGVKGEQVVISHS